jgi:heat-inducible transcriptional repressor
VPIDVNVSDDAIASASRRLVALRVEAETDPGSSDKDSTKLLALFDAALDEQDESPVFVGGTSAVAGIFDAVEQVQEVLQVLEKQYLVITLMRDVIERGLEVAIGSETGVEPLAECSLVVAPIEVDGTRAGSLGLLGPTRMNYPRAMATVALVSQQLGTHLREGAS